MDAYAGGPRAAAGGRRFPRRHRVGRVVLRQPGRLRGRQATRHDRYRRGARASRPGGRRERPARLPGVRAVRRLQSAGSRLEAAGAARQRPLWASTGTKNPDYSDTLYVTELVAPETVNTMPEATLEAVADHGEIRGDTVTRLLPTGPSRLRPAGRRRGRPRRRRAGTRGRGRREVRDELGRSARHRRGHAPGGSLMTGSRSRHRSADQAWSPTWSPIASRRGSPPPTPTLWGAAARGGGGSPARLGPAATRASRPLLAEIEALQADLRAEGLDRDRAVRHGRVFAGA